MEQLCTRRDCTVAQTGKCLLNNDPLNCPERTSVTSVSDPPLSPLDLGPVLKAPVEKPRFPKSTTLSPLETSDVMRNRYTKLIGIFGPPDAGKTAALVSLYLLLSQGKLKGLEYCESQSLGAFEQISRGARRWRNGQSPSQLTSHTELADERIAGFLHLRLHRPRKGDSHDLLLPDLPGEWSTDLIDQNVGERLNFMKRADAVWFMLSGKELNNPETRMSVLHRLNRLVERVTSLVGTSIPFTCVVTWLDLANPSDQTIERIKAIGTANGIQLHVASIASFATTPGTSPGAGIADLFSTVFDGEHAPRAPFWRASEISQSSRSIMQFRDFGSR